MSPEYELVVNGGLPITVEVTLRDCDPHVGEGYGKTWDDYRVTWIGNRFCKKEPRWVSAKYGAEIERKLSEIFA